MKKNNSATLKYILSIIVLVAMFHGIALADDKDHLNYVRLSSGFYQPAGDLDDAGYDSGVDLSFLFGRYFGKHLVFEGGFGFFYTEKDIVESTPSAGFYIEEDTVGILSVTATAKGVYPIGRLELFGGAGIGGYFVSFDADVTASNLGNVSTDDEDAVFGFHVTGGVLFNITERFLLGGEIKYLWTDDVEIVKQVSDIPIRLQGDLNGYSVNVTFGFRF
jgi:opacity protein-like surface antigen